MSKEGHNNDRIMMETLETCGSGREEDRQWARRNPADLDEKVLNWIFVRIFV